MSNWPLARAGASTDSFAVTQIDPSSTADVWGAWVQMAASAPSGVTGIRLSRTICNSNSATTIFQIGVGAAGSEQVVVDGFGLAVFDNFSDPATVIDLPVHIPAGQRVAVRSKGDQGSGNWHQLLMSFERASQLTPLTATRIACYGVQAGPTGTVVTPSLGSWGTPVEFVASTPHRARFVGLQMLRGANGYVRGLARACNATGTIQYGMTKSISGNGTSSLSYEPHFSRCDIPAGSSVYVQVGEFANSGSNAKQFLLLLGY